MVLVEMSRPILLDPKEVSSSDLNRPFAVLCSTLEILEIRSLEYPVSSIHYPACSKTFTHQVWRGWLYGEPEAYDLYCAV